MPPKPKVPPQQKFAAQLRALPAKPGVYIFKNAKGTILYVGKARSLKKRLASYFTKGTDSSKTDALLRSFTEVETIVTNTNLEALLLENTLIKHPAVLEAAVVGHDALGDGQPEASASGIADVSTIAPRAVLIRIADGFIQPISRRPTRSATSCSTTPASCRRSAFRIRPAGYSGSRRQTGGFRVPFGQGRYAADQRDPADAGVGGSARRLPYLLALHRSQGLRSREL